MRSSQPPSPYLETHLEAAPSWCLEASLSRASAPAAEWVRGPPRQVPPGRGGAGREVDPRDPGRRKRPRGAGAWRGPSLPHARSLPAARCGPYQVLRSEALHLARRAGGRALGALAEPAADRLGARRPTGEKGRSAAPRQPPSATDFAPCAVLSGPRAPPGPLGCSRRPARVPPHLPRGGAPRRSPKPPRGATPDLPA